MRRSVAKLGVALVAVVVAVVGVWGLIGPGSGALRAEGAAERFLQAISEGKDDQRAQWGEERVASLLSGFEPDDDTRFSTIEVGRATYDQSTATIPVRVVRNDGDDGVVEAVLEARRKTDDASGWRIVDVVLAQSVAVPSRGAARPARAPLGAWLWLTPVVLILAVASDILITRLRRRGPTAAGDLGRPTAGVISREELAAKLETGTIVLLDAQGPGWYEKGHIPGARPIDWFDIARSVALEVPEVQTEVAVYCWNAECIGSEVIADELVKFGYTRVNRYVGGKQDWVDHGNQLAAGEESR